MHFPQSSEEENEGAEAAAIVSAMTLFEESHYLSNIYDVRMYQRKL